MNNSAVSDRAAKFKSIIEKQKQSGPLLIVFTQFDPDAAASALGIRLLGNRIANLDCKIFYCGSIGHPQNKHIVSKFNLGRSIKPLVATSLKSGSQIALVDSSSVNDSRLPDGCKIDGIWICLDHHREEDPLEESVDSFIWVDDVGATSTLVVELVKELEIDFNSDGQWIATLLALGIYTDTHGLITASQRDRNAFTHVSEFFPENELRQLIDYPMPESYFRHIQRALSTMTDDGHYLIAGLGRLDPDEGDQVATAVDFFSKWEGKTQVWVWGIVGDHVRISARSRDSSSPLDQLMAKKFGQSGGAKIDRQSGKGEGGARLDLKFGIWLNDKTEDFVFKMVHQTLCDMLIESEQASTAKK